MASNPKRFGIGEFIADEARHAVRDIRQRLFEEAWFGRVVTAEPVIDVRETALDKIQDGRLADLWGRVLDSKAEPGHERPSFQQLWSPGEREREAPERERDDIDIER